MKIFLCFRCLVWGRGNEEDKVHPGLFVVAPERPAIDKLLAKEVLQILHWSVSAKLPLVFLLLDPVYRLEASKTVPSRDWCHVGPAHCKHSQDMINQPSTMLNGLLLAKKVYQM